MNANEQTLQQIERALKKVASKFPLIDDENRILTDIHLQTNQDSGELTIFDDNDNEITRCVVEEWIENKSDSFYEDIQPVIKKAIINLKDIIENMGLLKPYSFVLIGEDKETIAELYLIDDNTIMLDDELMKGLNNDLETFLNDLLAK